jgi:hypothetical protein
MHKWLRGSLVVTGIVGMVAALTAAGMYWASRQVPEFYERKLIVESADRDETDFERQALALHNQLQRAGRWEVRFTEEQINAWLAEELPEKFPRLLPPAISDPRVALEHDAVRLAARYRRGNVDTVLSFSGDAYLTDQPNEIAIRIRQARAGYLPLPLGKFLEEIRERAQGAEIPLRWAEIEGNPVALVRVPSDYGGEACAADEPQRLLLEEVSLKAGEFLVAGRIDEGDVTREALAAPVRSIQTAESETRQR